MISEAHSFNHGQERPMCAVSQAAPDNRATLAFAATAFFATQAPHQRHQQLAEFRPHKPTSRIPSIERICVPWFVDKPLINRGICATMSGFFFTL
jgi:hypothetical protein